jgi:hypothetical protein
VANLPNEVTDLPRQIQKEQETITSLSQQILAGQNAIAQGEVNEQAAWNRYIYTSDDYFSTTSNSRGGSSADTADTRRAAPYAIRDQIEQAKGQLEVLKALHETHMDFQNTLRRKLANAKVKAFFTGHFFDSLEIWDCSPR